MDYYRRRLERPAIGGVAETQIDSNVVADETSAPVSSTSSTEPERQPIFLPPPEDYSDVVGVAPLNRTPYLNGFVEALNDGDPVLAAERAEQAAGESIHISEIAVYDTPQALTAAIQGPLANWYTEILSTDSPLRDDLPCLSPPVDEPQFMYLAGTAGTGKTYLARLRSINYDDAILCATTGIAAVNLGGVTINATLRYFDTASMQTEYEFGRLGVALKQLAGSGFRRLIVDEVSMMDGKQLDILMLAVDDVNEWLISNHERPMGLTLCGDFGQLPPVNAPFAFERSSWQRFEPHTLTLTEPRRQADPEFVRALQLVRRGNTDAVDYFRPFIQKDAIPNFDGSSILAKNDEVDRLNKVRMLNLAGPAYTFNAVRTGKPSTDWKHIPDTLELKPEALVMILANAYDRSDPQNPILLYANGDLGHFTRPWRENDPQSPAWVRLHRTGQEVLVQRVSREHTKATGHKGVKAPRADVEGSIAYLPLRVAYGTTVHKCVAASTRIPVMGKGWLPIGEAKVGDVTPYGALIGMARSEQPAWRITTARGYSIVCSRDHRWQTKSGMKSADTFVAGDSIALHHGVPLAGRNVVTPTEAWVLGMVVGDGCSTDQDEGQIHLACMNKPLGDRFKKTAEELYGIPVAWRKDRRGLYWTSVGTRARLEELGLSYVTGRYKRVPSSIWLEGPKVRAWFLRGLFDADGHIGQHRIILTTASEKLGEDVQELLLTLGIVSSRKSYVSGYKQRGDRYWQVYVSAENFDRFVDQVNFFHEDKHAKLMRSRPNRALNPALGYDAVASVDVLDITIPMYDVEVPDPHMMAFGPFFGSNSQGLSLDNVQLMINSQFWMQGSMLYVGLSRARTPQGLKIVGSPDQFRARIRSNPKIARWL